LQEQEKGKQKRLVSGERLQDCKELLQGKSSVIGYSNKLRKPFYKANSM